MVDFINDYPFMEPFIKRIKIVKYEDNVKLCVEFISFADVINMFDLGSYSLPQIIVEENFFNSKGGMEGVEAFLF